jgi:chromosome segregation ATPase
MKYLDTTIITVLVSGLTGIMGWFAAQKKNLAEAKGKELDNVEKAVEIWRNSAEELSNQLRTYNQELLNTRNENMKLQAEIDKLLEINKKQRKEIEKLQKDVDELKKQNKRLEGLINKLK